MVSGTRQSARLANQADNEPEQLQEQTSPKGTKRKADTTSPKKSRGGKAAEQKKQKTLEETIDNVDAPNDDEMIEAAKAVEGTAKEAETKGEDTAENGQNADDAEQEDGTTREQLKQDDGKSGDHVSDGAVKQDSEREQNMPTNILEKGIVYFFTRGRVGIDDPEGPQDLQRTYFVMRPLPQGAKLGDGRIEDSDTNRLFALPKKTFPKSHSNRYMAFVEKGKTTMQSLKDTFFAGAEHETKTQGTRETPPATPIGEGVYAITETGRTTHLAYMLTIPQELGEVQEEMGLRSKGSFVISVKNPERKGPASAQLPQSPELPKEVIEEFRGLAWAPVKPQYLDYANLQILLIGEGTDGNLANALEPKSKDQKAGKEEPEEELEKLEHEDELRVQHLHGNDTVFDDLKLSKDEYPKVPTTW
ncbi:hypothetical protein GTA08_BOTSDO10847 [Botryosphaeria dothidea]|uniref:BTB domain transcription factor n=1 Tax=Botryosphaeria dothidea TaxID=55169 RepID=A0A8H4IGK6_9PEZI|nr:hypothetical protein GTA08_BOTSDO10847 [Botryosphaeria dothidea]